MHSPGNTHHADATYNSMPDIPDRVGDKDDLVLAGRVGLMALDLGR